MNPCYWCSSTDTAYQCDYPQGISPGGYDLWLCRSCGESFVVEQGQ